MAGPSGPGGPAAWQGPGRIGLIVVVTLAVFIAIPLAQGDAEDKDAPTSMKTDWSTPEQGMQIRLAAERSTWRADEVPAIRWSLVNAGEREFLQVAEGQRLALMEVDGVWYKWPAMLSGGRLHLLPPGKSLDDQLVTLGPVWTKAVPADLEWRRNRAQAFDTDRQAASSLVLSPGKHTVRIAVIVEPSRANTGEGFSVTSRKIELTVIEPAPDKARAWPPGPNVLEAVKAAMYSIHGVLGASPQSDAGRLESSVDEAYRRTKLAAKATKGSLFHDAIRGLEAALKAMHANLKESRQTAVIEFRKAAYDDYRNAIRLLSGEAMVGDGKVVPPPINQDDPGENADEPRQRG
jgi:hypothetical protein